MAEKEPTFIEYLAKRWFLVVGFIGGIAWLTRLHGLSMANADDVKALKENTKVVQEIPLLKDKIDRIDRSQTQMAEEQKQMFKVLTKIEAKL